MDNVELPLSIHDIRRIKNVLARIDMMEHRSGKEYLNDEIIISDKRIKEGFIGLKIYGVKIRPNENIGLNEGLVIRYGREPINFDFEKGYG